VKLASSAASQERRELPDFSQRFDALGAVGLLDHAASLGIEQRDLLQVRAEKARGAVLGIRDVASHDRHLAAICTFSHCELSFVALLE
jgi:hypothetical protein